MKVPVHCPPTSTHSPIDKANKAKFININNIWTLKKKPTTQQQENKSQTNELTNKLMAYH